MKTNVQKWGNNLGVRIPKSLAKKAELKDGTSVEVKIVDGSVMIESCSPDYSLQELVSEIREENRHKKIETGSSVGQEIW